MQEEKVERDTRHAQLIYQSIGRPSSEDLGIYLLDYLKRVHGFHMDLLGLPSSFTNWEQIEAYDEMINFRAWSDVTKGTSPTDEIQRRTIFAVGKDNQIVKVIDMVFCDVT